MAKATRKSFTTPPAPVPSAQLRIECADYVEFLSELPDGSGDLVLTDPPYIISRETGFANVKKGVQRFAVSMDFGDWDKVAIDLDVLAKQSYRVLRKGGTVIIFYDLWKIGAVEQALRLAGFGMVRLIIWEKSNPVPLNQRVTYLSNSREVAVCAVKGGKPTFHSRYHSGVYRYPIPRHGGRKLHPTQKPVDLFAELVRVHSNVGDVIIDPFLGSGTTAIAAVSEGRICWGCDIDAGYISAARVRQAELGGDV